MPEPGSTLAVGVPRASGAPVTSPAATDARARLAWGAISVCFIAVGALGRLWVAVHPIGTLTSDGSVIGLMALHVLHQGQTPAYMWGQTYGGGLEALLTAAVFKAAGVGTSQLLATTALTSALIVLALWRAARQIVGEPAARLAALALWAWPPLFTIRSLKPGGTYFVALAITWCAVNAIARLKRGDDRIALLAVLGVLAGLSFWSSPMCLQLLVPAAVWCRAPLRRLGRRLWVVVAGGVVGGFPVLWFAATHRATNLYYQSHQSFLAAMPGRFLQFFWWEWPIALGARVERTFRWVLVPLGPLLVVAATVGVVQVARAVLQGRAERCRLPILTLAFLPFLFALNTYANSVGQGRYVLFGATMGVLLVGVGLENLGRTLDARRVARTGRPSARVPWAYPVGLAALAVVGFLGLVNEPPLLGEFPAGGVLVPPNDTALQSLVRGHHVRDAFAAYWLAYRLTFETQERTLATPFTYERYPPIYRRVASSARPAYLFLSASPMPGRFAAWCAANHIATTTWRDGAFVVVQPASRVLPRQVPGRDL